MKNQVFSVLAAGVFLAGLLPAQTRPAFGERFLAHNLEMTALQPAMVTPLATPDPRLIQYVRLAVSHQYTASHAETVNYGNGRGGGVVVARRFEFDWMPPPYIEHNCTAKDGAGDTAVLAKVRIASRNAEHGNFEVSGSVAKSFATGSHSNGAATGVYTPTIVAGFGFRHRFDAISSLGGTLPTGKITTQG